MYFFGFFFWGGGRKSNGGEIEVWAAAGENPNQEVNSQTIVSHKKSCI